MLFVKDGIDKIQLPTLMIKVEKSTTSPLHDDVVLIITQCFPSKPNEYIGRLIGEDLKDPTARQLKGLEKPYLDALRVLHSKGVDPDILNQCKIDFDNINGMEDEDKHRWRGRCQSVPQVNHANLVGVINPTGEIPLGKVFIPRMGRSTPSRVFLTRSTCTEVKDGIVVEVAALDDMSENAVDFFASLSFCAIVFPLGDELPTKMSDINLDGDLCLRFWDEEILKSASIVGIQNNAGTDFFHDDDEVGTEFKYEINGTERNAMVVQKMEKTQMNAMSRLQLGREYQLSK